MSATGNYRNRIAILFDFDLTLAPDSFSILLRRRGADDPEGWRRRRVRPLVEDGREMILVRLSRPGEGGRRQPHERDPGAGADAFRRSAHARGAPGS